MCLVADPQTLFTVSEVSLRDQCVIIASDGLWDVVDPSEVGMSRLQIYHALLNRP